MKIVRVYKPDASQQITIQHPHQFIRYSAFEYDENGELQEVFYEGAPAYVGSTLYEKYAERYTDRLDFLKSVESVHWRQPMKYQLVPLKNVRIFNSPALNSISTVGDWTTYNSINFDLAEPVTGSNPPRVDYFRGVIDVPLRWEKNGVVVMEKVLNVLFDYSPPYRGIPINYTPIVVPAGSTMYFSYSPGTHQLSQTNRMITQIFENVPKLNEVHTILDI